MNCHTVLLRLYSTGRIQLCWESPHAVYLADMIITSAQTFHYVQTPCLTEIKEQMLYRVLQSFTLVCLRFFSVVQVTENKMFGE